MASALPLSSCSDVHLGLFRYCSLNEEKEDFETVCATTLILSLFSLSETTSFVIGVYVFVPFLVIDLIVSSILLGMGMMMLPPVLVSLPLKLMIFVLMDGWGILVRDMVAGIAR